jgi:hypothetical protein
METTKELTPSIGAAQRRSIPDSDSELNPYPLMAEASADVRVEAKATSTNETKALCPEQIPENLMKDPRMNADSEKLCPLPDRSAPPPESRQTDIPFTEDGLAVPESRSQTPDHSISPTSDPFRFPSAEPNPPRANLGVTSYNLYGLDNLDNPSPVKSLSSLAGSDSESGSDEEDGDKIAGNIALLQDFGFVGHEFNPPFTSTQKPGLETDGDAIGNVLPSNWFGEKLPSTSQLQAEINSQVDEFDKFMEADLGYDPVAL